VFDLERSLEIPQDMASFAALLLLTGSEWEKARQKSKPPKRKPDLELLNLLISALQARMADYPTSITVSLSLRTVTLGLNRPPPLSRMTRPCLHHSIRIQQPTGNAGTPSSFDLARNVSLKGRFITAKQRWPRYQQHHASKSGRFQVLQLPS
jgi:hypothetical protein